MASSTSNTTISDGLSRLQITRQVSAMHHHTSESPNQPAEGSGVKPTLETLLPEIKNEIFSYLLLAAKVKYSTNGSWPGHKYKFDVQIMRVSKQMKQDATAYLYSQNEFALISSKFFAFNIDRGRFLPTVATGKAARSFKGPVVEATITHVGQTLCTCCNPEKHKSKDRATHALFLVADLKHLVRELRLTYHMWPSKPIYIVSEPNASAVEHVPVNVDTQIKVVWKVNPSRRQDLTVVEHRARQIRLLDPLDFPTGCGKKISVVGVDKDIARKVVEQDMPRVLSVDAVGWDLYNLLKAQKTHLDTILSRTSASPQDLVHSYTDLACAGWSLDIQGFWKGASVTANVEMRDRMTSLCLLPFDKLDEKSYKARVSGSWQMGVLCLVLDCLYTIAKLCVENGSDAHLRECIQLIAELDMHTFRSKQLHLFPASLRVLLCHYAVWLGMNEQSTLPREVFVQSKSMLGQARNLLPADDQDDVWRHINTDWEFLNRVEAGEAQLYSKNFGSFPSECVNFQGLLNRPRLHNTPFHPNPPREAFNGWTTKREFPKPEVAAHMMKFADEYPKLNFIERVHRSAEAALYHQHTVTAFVNPPKGQNIMPPGAPPGIPPGFPGGGLGFSLGPVTTLGALMGNTGGSGGAPHT